MKFNIGNLIKFARLLQFWLTDIRDTLRDSLHVFVSTSQM